MKIKQRSALRAGLLVCSVLLGFWPAAVRAQKTDAPKSTDPVAAVNATKDETVVLSPFTVSTDKDRGYAATNAISGSRIDTAIKDLPIPIQVITSEFISDIGATDLRSSLAYTSGIMLQTQNDLENSGGTYGSPYGPGGVNNPQGLTANINQVQLKIRGFVTTNVLRDGFFRENSTDSVNIDRIEVVAGPNALLYGTGNFGGVVDYLTKQPLDVQQGNISFTYGLHDFMRGALDVTGPISAANHLDYRVDVSAESGKTNIDSQKNSHYFVAPAVSWKPTPTTELLIDTEFGKSRQSGYGFQALRAVQGTGSTPIDNDQIEAVAFYWPPGADHRSFNLSGPDTYNNQQASNIEIKLTQHLLKESKFLPEVNFLAGYNHSKTTFDTRSVNGQISGPVTTGDGSDVATTIYTTTSSNSIDGQGSNNGNLVFGPLPASVVKYNWGQHSTDATRDQERVELTARKSLFQGTWYQLEDQLLAGYSEILNNVVDTNWSTIPNKYSFKNPTELTPIRFGKQGNGSPDPALFNNDLNNRNKIWDAGMYLNNYARLFNDRIILMDGVRQDKINNWLTDTQITAPGATPATTTNRAMQSKTTTHQNGVILKVTKNLSLYGLQAEGISPNFNGLRDNLTGLPVGSDYAKSRELGIKFDFLDGKISGTISHYTITKTAFVQQPWWTPAPGVSGKLRFNPAKDIIYSLSDFNASGAPGSLYNYPVNSASSYSITQRAPSTVAAWNAANASGAIYLQGGKLYVDASKPTGAAYMDAAFAANQASGGDWPGWLYDETDPNVNNATMDAAGFLNTSLKAAWQIIDQAKGWDGQILFTPNENLQFVLTASLGSSITRLNMGKWPKYPGPADKWAVWYFQNGSWGLEGQPLNVAYANPADTSTRTNAGVFPGDDTPKDAVDFFTNYKFSGRLKGLAVGIGGQWHSKEEFFSGVTHGGGQVEQNAAGKTIIAYSPPRTTINMFAKYTFKRGKFNQYVQLNIDNLLDDKKIYGLIYATGITGKISYGTSF